MRVKKRSAVLAAIAEKANGSDVPPRSTAAITLAHMIVQGRQAATTGCKYRLEEADGRVLYCAAGFWVPDDLYSQALEGRTVSKISVFTRPFSMALDINTLSALQAFHDSMMAATFDDAKLLTLACASFYQGFAGIRYADAMFDIANVLNIYFIEKDGPPLALRELESCYKLGYTPE